MNKARPVGLLIVGLGRQGLRHARVAQQSGVELIATVDPGAEAIAGVPHFTSVSEALARQAGAVDGAVVATHSSTHLEVAKELIEAGVPTLVEKPMARDPESATQLTALAERSGVLVATGHVERFNPCVGLVTELLAGGSLGRPIACSFRRVGLPPPATPDVNVIMDLGVHDIDVFAVITGTAPSLIGASGWVGPDHLVESAHVLMNAGSVHGLIEVNWRTPVRLRSFAITTDECLVEVNYTTQSVEVVQASKVQDFNEFSAFRSHYGRAQRTHFEAKVAEPLAEQTAEFARAIRGTGYGRLATAADGARAVRLAHEASQAIEGDRTDL